MNARDVTYVKSLAQSAQTSADIALSRSSDAVNQARSLQQSVGSSIRSAVNTANAASRTADAAVQSANAVSRTASTAEQRANAALSRADAANVAVQSMKASSAQAVQQATTSAAAVQRLSGSLNGVQQQVSQVSTQATRAEHATAALASRVSTLEGSMRAAQAALNTLHSAVKASTQVPPPAPAGPSTAVVQQMVQSAVRNAVHRAAADLQQAQTKQNAAAEAAAQQRLQHLQSTHERLQQAQTKQNASAEAAAQQRLQHLQSTHERLQEALKAAVPPAPPAAPAVDEKDTQGAALDNVEFVARFEDALKAVQGTVQHHSEQLQAVSKAVQAASSAQAAAHGHAASGMQAATDALRKEVDRNSSNVKACMNLIAELGKGVDAVQDLQAAGEARKEGASAEQSAAVQQQILDMQRRLSAAEVAAAAAASRAGDVHGRLDALRAVELDLKGRDAAPAVGALDATPGATSAVVLHPSHSTALLGDGVVLPGLHTTLHHAGVEGAPSQHPPARSTVDGLQGHLLTRHTRTSHAMQFAFVNDAGEAVERVTCMGPRGDSQALGTPGCVLRQSESGAFRTRVHLPNALRVQGVAQRDIAANVTITASLHVHTVTTTAEGREVYGVFSVGATGLQLRGAASHTDTADAPRMQRLSKAGVPLPGKLQRGVNTVKYLSPSGATAAGAVQSARGFMGVPSPSVTLTVRPTARSQHRVLLLDEHLRLDPALSVAEAAADGSGLRPAPEGVVLGHSMSTTVTRAYNRAGRLDTTGNAKVAVAADTFPRRLGITVSSTVAGPTGGMVLHFTVDAPFTDEDAGQPAIVGIEGTMDLDVVAMAVAPPGAEVLPLQASLAPHQVPRPNVPLLPGQRPQGTRTHTVLRVDDVSVQGRTAVAAAAPQHPQGAPMEPCWDTNSWMHPGGAAAWPLFLNDPTPPDAAADRQGDEFNIRLGAVKAVAALVRIPAAAKAHGRVPVLPALRIAAVPKEYYEAFKEEPPSSPTGAACTVAAAAELPEDIASLVDTQPVTRPQVVLLYVTADGAPLDDWAAHFPHFTHRMPAATEELTDVSLRQCALCTEDGLHSDEILERVELLGGAPAQAAWLQQARDNHEGALRDVEGAQDALRRAQRAVDAAQAAVDAADSDTAPPSPDSETAPPPLSVEEAAAAVTAAQVQVAHTEGSAADAAEVLRQVEALQVPSLHSGAFQLLASGVAFHDGGSMETTYFAAEH